MSKYDLAPVFNEEEFRHWFLPREDIVDCYVVEDAPGRYSEAIQNVQ